MIKPGDSQTINLENRRKANTKYYSKEENKEHKRAYAREYARRPEVIARRKAYYYTLKGHDYYKKYYQDTMTAEVVIF